MIVKQYSSIRGARKCWGPYSAEHAFQHYEVMCAFEKSYWRNWIYHSLLRPWWWILYKEVFSVYEICDDDGTPVLLAPVLVLRRTHRIRTVNTFDYQDFLYGDQANENQRADAWRALFAHWRKAGFQALEISYLPDAGTTAQLFRKLSLSEKELSRSCVTLVDLGSDGHEKYFASLGKHARQNVRTAYNRLNRDGHRVKLAFFDRAGLGQSLDSESGRAALNDGERLYFKRQSGHYGKKQQRSFWRWIWMKVFDPISISSQSPDAVLSILYFDNRIAAYMYGFIRKNKSAIELPRLAIEDDFGWYSPGLLLINETAKYFFEHQGPRIIDLCQGDEKYKLDMGGRTAVTRHLVVQF